MIVGRNTRRSAKSAAIIAKAESQPNSLRDGKSENTVTASPQASTTVVKMRAGPTRTVARSTPIAGRLVRPVFEPQPVQEMDRRAKAKPERNGKGNDARKLKSASDKPKQNARGEDREYRGQNCGQHHNHRAERQPNESGNENDLYR